MRRLNRTNANDGNPEQLVWFANTASGYWTEETSRERRECVPPHSTSPLPHHVVDPDPIDPVHIDPDDPTHLVDFQRRVAACSCVQSVLVRHNATSFDRKVRMDILQIEAAERYTRQFGGHAMGVMNLLDAATFQDILESALHIMNGVIQVDTQYGNTLVGGVFYVWCEGMN